MNRKRFETVRKLKVRKTLLHKAKSFHLRLARRRLRPRKTTVTPREPQ